MQNSCFFIVIFDIFFKLKKNIKKNTTKIPKKI